LSYVLKANIKQVSPTLRMSYALCSFVSCYALFSSLLCFVFMFVQRITTNICALDNIFLFVVDVAVVVVVVVVVAPGFYVFLAYSKTRSVQNLSPWLSKQLMSAQHIQSDVCAVGVCVGVCVWSM